MLTLIGYSENKKVITMVVSSIKADNENPNSLVIIMQKSCDEILQKFSQHVF